MKTFSHKAKAQSLGWEDVQEMQQQKKANKSLRDMKKGRKMQWQIEA